ncbi:MAG TPA: PEGA domain-containing protein, partial [Polyangiaceae bacterium]|nr:PEGA domain-containing protein [Polyangiaceae bacterium]
MKPSSLATALLIAFAPIATTAPCRAQSASDDATTAMARSRFKEGVNFYDKGEYELARASFLQAYALKKHPAILLNLAWSSLKAGHALEGHRYFKQFLSEGKDITDKQRADANDGLAQTRVKLGQIDIVAPAGADVTVDGERVGTTPLAEAPLVEMGAHSVKVRMPDGSADTQNITVLAGERAVARFVRTPPPSIPTPPPVLPAPAPPPPVSLPAPAPTVPPPSPSVSTNPPPADEGTGAETHRTIWVPKNLIPVYILVPLSLGSAGLAIAMGVAKDSAQEKANNTAADILKHGGRCNPNGGPPGLDPQALASACQVYADDNNSVNLDATVGNIAAGVAAAAFVGAVVYWIAATK